VINFIAIEPVVNRVRCYSELERSDLDGRNGKRFWSCDRPDFSPRPQDDYASGTIDRSGSEESLQVYIMAEPFKNGARVHLRLGFRADAPDEVDLEAFSSPGSAELQHCILTATMGNFARLRELHLRDKTVSSLQLWPDYQEPHFAPARAFPLSDFLRTPYGDAFVSATPNEENPAAAKAPGHWNFVGARATQYWHLKKEEARSGTVARVNGRYTYWMSKRPIPGGISFENFELERPFRNGEKSTFGITTSALTIAKSLLADP